MNYSLIQDVLLLLQEFESSDSMYTADSIGFQQWIANKVDKNGAQGEPAWEGKEKGRTPESVISTQLVHLNRYARNYSRAAMQDSDFSTQEEFIYLINLQSFGAMSKMALIKKNVHDKPTGMKIIDRLIHQGWVQQKDSKTDGRSKQISITKKGVKALAAQMDKIRMATRIITGKLTRTEKMTLIGLLDKLENFHDTVFKENIAYANLLEHVSQQHLAN